MTQPTVRAAARSHRRSAAPEKKEKERLSDFLFGRRGNGARFENLGHHTAAINAAIAEMRDQACFHSLPAIRVPMIMTLPLIAVANTRPFPTKVNAST